MKRLPNRITSDVELHQWCASRLPGFTRVVDRTKFPRLFSEFQPGSSCIINLDPEYRRGGTHWVAAKMSREKYLAPGATLPAHVLMYCDSFGAPPPVDVVRAAHSRGMKVLYPNNVLQKIRETNCGRRAAEWLVAFDRPDDVSALFARYS